MSGSWFSPITSVFFCASAVATATSALSTIATTQPSRILIVRALHIFAIVSGELRTPGAPACWSGHSSRIGPRFPSSKPDAGPGGPLPDAQLGGDLFDLPPRLRLDRDTVSPAVRLRARLRLARDHDLADARR